MNVRDLLALLADAEMDDPVLLEGPDHSYVLASAVASCHEEVEVTRTRETGKITGYSEHDQDNDEADTVQAFVVRI